MPLTFDVGKDRLNFRVGAVCIDRGRLLLENSANYPFKVVPGGRCEMHEPSEQTLRRELMEEIGAAPSSTRLLWVVENFFALDGRRVHEIGFFYAALFAVEDPVLRRAGAFRGPENSPELTYEWVPFERLGETQIFPHFLVERLNSLPRSVEHVLWDELSR